MSRSPHAPLTSARAARRSGAETTIAAPTWKRPSRSTRCPPPRRCRSAAPAVAGGSRSTRRSATSCMYVPARITVPRTSTAKRPHGERRNFAISKLPIAAFPDCDRKRRRSSAAIGAVTSDCAAVTTAVTTSTAFQRCRTRATTSRDRDSIGPSPAEPVRGERSRSRAEPRAATRGRPRARRPGLPGRTRRRDGRDVVFRPTSRRRDRRPFGASTRRRRDRSAEGRSDGRDPLRGPEALEDLDEGGVGHPRPEVGPPERAALHLEVALPFGRREDAPRRRLERDEVHVDLRGQPLVEEAADVEKAADGGVDLGGAPPGGERLDHEHVELGVLRLLHPVVAEQALELRVQTFVVLHALEVVPLGHPLDLEGDEGDRERVVGEDLAGDDVAGAYRPALGAEALAEILPEAAEELDVLRLLAGELEEGSDARVVPAELRPRVVDDEGEDELLDEAERREVLVPADLVERPLLGGRQELEALDASEGLGEEGLAEVEPLLASDQVLDAPADLFRRGERRRTCRH